jgi:hypothetical protein
VAVRGELEFLRMMTGMDGTLADLRVAFYSGVLDGSIVLGGGGGGGAPLGVAKVGRYIGTAMQLDAVNSDANVFGTSGQTVWLTPMAFAEATPIDRLGQSIGVAGNGNLLLGLYEFGYGTINQIAAASTPANAPGDKQLTVAATAPAGLVWGASGTTDTSGTLTVRRGSARQFQHGPLAQSVGWELESYLGMRINGVNLAGGLPATLDVSTPAAYQRTDVPLVWARVAP